MLELLTFDLMVDNPYHRLFDLLSQLEVSQNKTLRQAAWAFCNDACLTSLPLLMDARDVAVAAIFFASAHTSQPIDDVGGDPWWRHLGGDEERCVRAIDGMRQFYTENPLRRQNPSIGSPAFLLENTRRRGEALLSQTPPPAATPLGGAESPRAPNGGERARDGSVTAVRDHGSRSPAKRKEADSEVEDGRDRKRLRSASDGEEGELVDS